jgi:hypothetical protein
MYNDGTMRMCIFVVCLLASLAIAAACGGDEEGGVSGSRSGFVEVAAGALDVSMEFAPGMPSVPPGLAAVSVFAEFSTEGRNTFTTIGLSLHEPIDSAAGLGFYTFANGEWRRLADVTLTMDGTQAEGDFKTVPVNLAVLRSP